MKVYITPAGKTALLVTNFLERPKAEFGFDLAIMLSDTGYTNKLYEKYREENLLIVPISNPYFGDTDYLPTVRRLVKQTLTYVRDPELIIINSSGGTEKMTNIVKDAGDILGLKYEIMRVFGVYDTITKDVIFTIKPEVDHFKEITEITNDVNELFKLKERLDGNPSMDIN